MTKSNIARMFLALTLITSSVACGRSPQAGPVGTFAGPFSANMLVIRYENTTTVVVSTGILNMIQYLDAYGNITKQCLYNTAQVCQ